MNSECRSKRDLDEDLGAWQKPDEWLRGLADPRLRIREVQALAKHAVASVVIPLTFLPALPVLLTLLDTALLWPRIYHLHPTSRDRQLVDGGAQSDYSVEHWYRSILGLPRCAQHLLLYT